MRQCKSILLWAAPAIWAGMIFYLSHLSGDETPSLSWFPHMDKLLHFALYAILAILLYLALRRERNVPTRKAALYALAVSLIYGVSDEIHQSFVPGRCAAVADLAADSLGTMLAICISVIIDRRCKFYGHK